MISSAISISKNGMARKKAETTTTLHNSNIAHVRDQH
jgi:hypothetical protein